MPLMTAADCVAFCVLIASAVWIAAIFILKRDASESKSKIELNQRPCSTRKPDPSQPRCRRQNRTMPCT